MASPTKASCGTDPVASLLPKAIGCSHHHCLGIIPCCLLPCLHAIRIRHVTTYTANVSHLSEYILQLSASHTSLTNPLTWDKSRPHKPLVWTDVPWPSDKRHGCGHLPTMPEWPLSDSMSCCHKVGWIEPLPFVNLAGIHGWTFSHHNTVPKQAHTPWAFHICCQMAGASWLSCTRSQPRYLNTST